MKAKLQQEKDDLTGQLQQARELNQVLKTLDHANICLQPLGALLALNDLIGI